jgi:hypothetical protein
VLQSRCCRWRGQRPPGVVGAVRGFALRTPSNTSLWVCGAYLCAEQGRAGLKIRRRGQFREDVVARSVRGRIIGRARLAVPAAMRSWPASEPLTVAFRDDQPRRTLTVQMSLVRSAGDDRRRTSPRESISPPNESIRVDPATAHPDRVTRSAQSKGGGAALDSGPTSGISSVDRCKLSRQSVNG